MAEGRFDPESGHWLAKDGTPIQFLPEVPANSPPHELISTTEPDSTSPDGHTHYPIGSDAAVVDAIIKHYKDKRGLDVPAGYKTAAAKHAAAVKKQTGKQAGDDTPGT